MAQVIHTRDIVDVSTGEVQTKEIFRKRVETTETFIRTYIQDIGALAKCSGAEQSTILCSLKYIDYDTNELIIDSMRRQEIAECGNLKLSTVNTALARLIKKNLLIKISSSRYVLNPKIFFYGKDIERAKVLQATITYIIG